MVYFQGHNGITCKRTGEAAHCVYYLQQRKLLAHQVAQCTYLYHLYYLISTSSIVAIYCIHCRVVPNEQWHSTIINTIYIIQNKFYSVHCTMYIT